MIQAKFEDALHGRAPEYAEWLDLVERQPSKVSRLTMLAFGAIERISTAATA